MLAALTEFSAVTIANPDTGSVHGDLRVLAGDVATALSQPPVAALMRSMITLPDEWPARTGAASGPTGSCAPRSSSTRAVARGELSASADPSVVFELLVAPIWFRLLVSSTRSKMWRWTAGCGPRWRRATASLQACRPSGSGPRPPSSCSCSPGSSLPRSGFGRSVAQENGSGGWREVCGAVSRNEVEQHGATPGTLQVAPLDHVRVPEGRREVLGILGRASQLHRDYAGIF